jgi:hypothetical protein
LEYGVHYDCGCVLTGNGDLSRFDGQVNATAIAVPAVYVAYFSTFGAMVRFSSLTQSLHIILHIGLAFVTI